LKNKNNQTKGKKPRQKNGNWKTHKMKVDTFFSRIKRNCFVNATALQQLSGKVNAMYLRTVSAKLFPRVVLHTQLVRT